MFFRWCQRALWSVGAQSAGLAQLQAIEAGAMTSVGGTSTFQLQADASRRLSHEGMQPYTDAEAASYDAFEAVLADSHYQTGKENNPYNGHRQGQMQPCSLFSGI